MNVNDSLNNSEVCVSHQINAFLSVKFNGKETMIYVKDEPFTQCKYLLFAIPTSQVKDYDMINSIDEAVDLYKHLKGREARTPRITPEQEFWGHCSNLQAWAEHDYDTRLLRNNLSFPLLKKLTDAGDPIAKRVFKEEIVSRIAEGYRPTTLYLVVQGYLKYFTREELEIISENFEKEYEKFYIQHYKGLYKNLSFKDLSDHYKKDAFFIRISWDWVITEIKDDVHFDENAYGTSYSLNERKKFKRIKHANKSLYEFNIRGEKYRFYVMYKYFWSSYRILNKNKDCKIYIPLPKQWESRAPYFCFESKKEGLRIYVRAHALSLRGLHYSLKNYRIRMIKRIMNRRKKALQSLLDPIFKTLYEANEKCKTCAYSWGNDVTCWNIASGYIRSEKNISESLRRRCPFYHAKFKQSIKKFLEHRFAPDQILNFKWRHER